MLVPAPLESSVARTPSRTSYEIRAILQKDDPFISRPTRHPQDVAALQSPTQAILHGVDPPRNSVLGTRLHARRSAAGPFLDDPARRPRSIAES
jgi:hypothetical protein